MTTTHTHTRPPVTRRCRQTGLLVTVASAHDCAADIRDPDARWFTICEEHGTAVAHRTRQQADEWAADPLTWCWHCNENRSFLVFPPDMAK